MWKAHYQMITDVSPERLYRAISDVNNWSKWDTGLEDTQLAGDAKPGSTFTLRPKGGPRVRMSIDEARPYLFVDTAHLLGARMRTTHEYVAAGGQTTVTFGVEVSGPLGFFWRKVVAEKQIKEAPVQLAAFVAYARTTP